MVGLSITAIGMRSLLDCINIYDILQPQLKLNYLELAIGSICSIDFPYPKTPLVLHDSCLYHHRQRYCLRLNEPETWTVYADFIENHQNVLAVSLHAPRKWECSLIELERSLIELQKILQVPVFIETMPTKDYWCSDFNTLVDFPILLDVSHILMWHQGSVDQTAATCQKLLATYQVGSIHLSHNQGYADTHDLIPIDAWFNESVADWGDRYLVTYESLPITFSQYQRLDKIPNHKLAFSQTN
jgi:hypothetical protein